MTTTSNGSALSASRALERASISIQVGDDRTHGGPLGGLLRLHGEAEVEEAHEALVVAKPHRFAASGRAHHGRRAPVPGEPPSVCGEQDDVCRAGGRMEVLLVLQ